MGGRYEVELCISLVEEHFGISVSKVAEALMKESGPLPVIVNRLKNEVKLSIIRRALVVLEQHGMVKFKLDQNLRIIYTVDRSAILSLARAARCCLIVKTLYGGLAEAICEELFSHGRLTCSDAIRRIANRIEQPIGEVKEKFCRLAEAQFVTRCPPIESVLKGCPQFVTVFDPFIMPDMVILSDEKNDQVNDSCRKRKANDDQNDYDKGIYWRINWIRFDRYIRDEMVLELLVPKNSVGEKSMHIFSQTVRALLKANEVRVSSPTANNTAPVSVFDMMRCVKENELGIEKADLEWALRSLADESRGVLRKAGDSGGGLFVIDFERGIQLICQSHIESLIREQLESRAVRIFRLLQLRGYLEEDQIEKLTMMSSKETRELLYAMLEEGYVFTKPIGKTNDFAPARTFFLYHVNLPQTVRGLVEYTCKVMRNIVLRRSFESREHKHLAERQVKMESIIETIASDDNLDEETKKQQMAEVEEMYLSNTDRTTLERFRRAQTLLIASETESEKALFAFRLFMDFASRVI